MAAISDGVRCMVQAIKAHTQVVRVVVFGLTGHGKSATLNAFLRALGCHDANDPAFHFMEGDGIDSETGHIREITVTVDGVQFTFTDVPGLLDTEGRDVELQRAVAESHLRDHDGYHLVLYVLKKDRITDVVLATIALLKAFYTNGIATHSLLAITHADSCQTLERENAYRAQALARFQEADVTFPTAETLCVGQRNSTPSGRDQRVSGEVLMGVLSGSVIRNEGKPFRAEAPDVVVVQKHINRVREAADDRSAFDKIMMPIIFALPAIVTYIGGGSCAIL
jgi:AIG1 family